MSREYTNHDSSKGHTIDALNKSVVLSYNVKAGLPIARVLAGQDWLQHYIGVTNFHHLPLALKTLPSTRVLNLLNRRLINPSLDVHPRTNVLLSDFLLSAAQKLPGSPDLATRLLWSQRHFDHIALRHVKGAKVYHFASGVGATSGAAAQQGGAFLICHRRAIHHETEADIVRQSVGPAYEHPEHRMHERLTTEYRIADLILCNSDLSARSFEERGFARNKLRVIHNSVDTSFFTPSVRRSTAGPLRVLYVGSLDQRKGTDLLIQAAAHLRGKIQLRIVGSIIDSSFQMPLSRHDENITFLGPMNPVQLREEYRDAHVTVLPSRIDAFGYVAAESLACGTPVIASDQVGASEVIAKYQAGWIFESGNLDSLIHCIEQSLDERDRDAASNAAVRARSYLGWDRYATELVSMYKSLSTT